MTPDPSPLIRLDQSPRTVTTSAQPVDAPVTYLFAALLVELHSKLGQLGLELGQASSLFPQLCRLGLQLPVLGGQLVKLGLPLLQTAVLR